MNTFKYYSEILDQLIEKNEFFKFYFQCPYSLELYDSLADDYFAPRHVSMEFGATRGTIISDECDEVVKFNLDSYEDDASDTEVAVYQAAIMAKLDRCFARAYYCGTYRRKIRTWPAAEFDFDNDDWSFTEDDFCRKLEELDLREEDKCEINIVVPLYAYEKANNVGYTSTEWEDEEESIASSYDSPLLERNTEIGASFVHEYGETIYAELSAFLNEWQVNDIHNGNIGWIGNRFVLIDYAGCHN